MAKYDFKKIESKWQKFWEEKGTYNAKNDSKKEKKYVLIEFPYPSGEGLHMGHLRPYVAGDVYSRYLRMSGYEVMYPIGWDAFGLPAENYAIKMGIQPRLTTAKNIENAKRQIKSWGIGFDWAREVNTTDPAYYKWTQWIFLQFWKAGLAYEATGKINWCPKDKTGLANEEVINGKCERCGTKVEEKELRQWYLKITAYAEKLLSGLKDLNWPAKIKIQQANWIGRSEGALLEFPVKDSGETIEVFTTRPDTLFGATYMVLSPEHALVQGLKDKIENFGEVEKYIAEAKKKTDIERTEEKTGVELRGVKAINPANKEELPIFIADYVLSGYGTGAIMAVPAHDQRDFEFAKKFNLPIRIIVARPGLKGLAEAFEASGVLISSGKFDGMGSEKAKWEITKFVGGKKKIQYRLRDWIFSRQRYWGEPIPLIHCEKCGVVPVPEEDLPVKLPEVEKYEPTGTGESPLAAIEDWVNTKCPKCGGRGRRETNTMPQWAGSSWYYLRYADPQNSKVFADKKLLKHWLPVDVYFGGMEHTTLHLLYSRFWHEFLYDQKYVPTPEPYEQRVPHGIILGPDGEKMSKSRGNVVNPDKVAENFGADALKMYELFLGPHDATVSWSDQGILGISRFLERVWKFFSGNPVANFDPEALPYLHRATKKVGEDITNFHFNTAISSLMILLNEVEKHPLDLEGRRMFLKILAPFAPHLSEELWHELDPKAESIHVSSWPKYDPKLCVEKEITLIVQINGKIRASIELPAGTTQKEAESAAIGNVKIAEQLQNKTPKRVVYIPDRLINFVI